MSCDDSIKVLVKDAIEALKNNDTNKVLIFLTLADQQLKATTAVESSAFSRRVNTIKEFVSNPLLLLIVGAVISGLLVPSITSQWQNYQKELEIKSNLTGKISEALSRMIVAIQGVEIQPETVITQEYNDEFREWQISSSIIASQVRTYYPDQPELVQQWNNLSKLIDEFYALPGTPDPENRWDRIQRIKAYFPSDLNLNWTSLSSRSNWTEWEKNWFELKDAILLKNDELIQKLVRSNIRL
jgi:hypothetical protein